MPKKPISSYFFFNTEYGAKLRAENPTNTSMKYIAPLVKEKWDTMDEQHRKPYEDMAEKDKLRFQKEKKMLDDHGYFMLADGSKSTDPQNIPKKKRKSTKSMMDVTIVKNDKISVKDVKNKIRKT